MYPHPTMWIHSIRWKHPTKSKCCSALCVCVYTHVVICCSVWQCFAVFCSELQWFAVSWSELQCFAVSCSVLQWVAVCCSDLQRVAVSCSDLQCFAVYCSELQCVAVCCSVLQRAPRRRRYLGINTDGSAVFDFFFKYGKRIRALHHRKYLEIARQII